MIRFLLPAVIIFILSFNQKIFSSGWSVNDVFKFGPGFTTNFCGIEDYQGIGISNGYIYSANPTNSWLKTKAVGAEIPFAFDSAFINADPRVLSPESNACAVMEVRNSDDDSVIARRIFYSPGRIDLDRTTATNLYILISLSNSGINVYSFGFTRELIDMVPGKLSIKPSVLFYGEEPLSVSFRVTYPVIMDILIFNPDGMVTDILSKGRSFSEGDYLLKWDPEINSSGRIITGFYNVYLSIKSPDGKMKTEKAGQFYLVNR